ncbi:MAG: hypothetical protein M1829_003413 [Trizodia sp. TS-e1964]|nr:MAG: hypothetical protein M1829_003413 [Trizodia sp. TS-e1964]
MKLQGRTFVVSGGASGLGKATVVNLCQAGANVSILDLNEESGKQLVQDIGPEQAKFIKTDVSCSKSIAAAVQASLEWIRETGMELGGIITAAGVGTAVKIIDRTGEPLPLDSFDFVMNINLRGTIDLIRQLLPHLSKVEPLQPDGERGVLVMVSSAAAFDGQPGQVAYAASKGAVAAMTLPMTRDLARYGIRVISIAPSLFESGMTANLPGRVRESLRRVMEFPRRAGKPEEFASLVRQCIENVMLNGVVLRLDGGLRMPSKM